MRFFVLSLHLLFSLCIFYNGPLKATPQVDEAVALSTIGEWQFSLALGYGKKQSAISGQDDFSLYLVPNLSYYGQNLFFDNGTFGFTMLDKPKYALSVISELNPNIAQYYGYHPNNIFVLNATGDANDDLNTSASVEEPRNEGEVEFDDMLAGPSQIQDITLLKPDWSIDVGLQHNWFLSSKVDITSQLFTDLSGIHDGKRASLQWAFRQPLDGKTALSANWLFTLQLGLDWLDATTTNYYYGIDSRHTRYRNHYYQPGSALNGSVKLSLTKQLNNDISVVMLWKTQILDTTLAYSPYVDNKEPQTYFLGMMYAF